MPNYRNFPVGTIGWTGSTMRENLQEDIFMPCEDRLVAVNVGPDGTFGSLVYDTNENNEYDAERSAYLQSAFRVIKHPLGQANAIGFQLYWAGNKDTKGGYFVDLGDGSKTVKNTATPSNATAGSNMVATGYINRDPNPIASDNSTSFDTTDAGKSGGLVIGQGSYNDGGPFHVGNNKDIHYTGMDADGNPINSLHIWTGANFYKNQVEDGPLRFEDKYQKGTDQSIIVPVHLGWAGGDWAWWSTSYMYQPDKPPPPDYPSWPMFPYTPQLPGVPTTGVPTVPVIGGDTISDDKRKKPPGLGLTVSVDLRGTIPRPGTPTLGPQVGGYVPPGGNVGGPTNPGAGGGTPPPTPTNPAGGATSGIGGSTGGSEYDEAGTGDDRIPGADGKPIDSDTGQPYGGNPAGGSKGTGGGDGSGGSGGGGAFDGVPVKVVPNLPIQPQPGPWNPVRGRSQTHGNTIVGNSSHSAPLNLVTVAGALNTTVQTYQASSYSPNAIAGSALNANAGPAAENKQSNTSPQIGGFSSFAGQGGTTAAGISGSGTPFPSVGSGGQGDPWLYVASPRDQQMSSTSPKSKYRSGTANGGICYHPAETDLRDAQSSGMSPPGVTLNTFLVMTAPKAYFGCGVPEIINGGIKSGYQWGVDSTTGDIVFQSVSSSQPAEEAVRFTNTSQNIQWTSQSGRAAYGELAHYNTGARTWTFQDKSGYVLCSDGNVGFYGTVPIAKATVTGAKGGNAALGSLMTALAAYGLVTDTTTA